MSNLIQKIKDLFASLFGKNGKGSNASSAGYNVVLTSAGNNKLDVIKKVREITGCDLITAKNIVEAAPKTVISTNSKDKAESAVERLTAVGATAEIQE